MDHETEIEPGQSGCRAGSDHHLCQSPSVIVHLAMQLEATPAREVWPVLFQKSSHRVRAAGPHAQQGPTSLLSLS